MKKLFLVLLCLNALVFSGCATKYSDDGINDASLQKENVQQNITNLDKEISELNTQDSNTKQIKAILKPNSDNSFNKESATRDLEDSLDDDWGSLELHSRGKFIRKRYQDGMLSDGKNFYPTQTRSLQSQCDDFKKFEQPFLPIEVQRDEGYTAEAIHIKTIDNQLVYTVLVYEGDEVNLAKVGQKDADEVWLYTYDCVTNTPNSKLQLSAIYDYYKYLDDDTSKELLYGPIIGISDRYYYSMSRDGTIRVHDSGSFWKQAINIKQLPQRDAFLEEMSFQTGKSKDILEFNGINSENIVVNKNDEIVLTIFHKPLPVPSLSPHIAMGYGEYYQGKMDIYRE